MQIDLTPAEYSNLLDLLAVAEWAIQDIPEDANLDTTPFDALIDKVHAHAGDFGCGHLIETLPEADRPTRTDVFHESSDALPLIDECEDRVFWDELVSRLAEQVILGKYTDNELIAMSDEDKDDLLERTEILVYKKLRARGMEALKLEEIGSSPRG